MGVLAQEPKRNNKHMLVYSHPAQGAGNNNGRAQSWKILQGLARIDAHSTKTQNPMFYVQLATRAVEIPKSDSSYDISKAAVPNPNPLATGRQAVLRKHRAVLKVLVSEGVIGKELIGEIPPVDAKRRLNPAHVLISNRLGRSGHGLKTLIRNLARICWQIGDRDADALPRDVKEKIVRGELVHPLALKQLHHTAKP